jgi:outer membrane translocation and assembly module TamA
LRGYAANRYRDVHFLGAQVEYRFPLFWRFGANTFVGGGDVFSHPGQIDLSQLKYSVGAGLRFVITTAERINIRFDYAYGREGGTFYFNIAEAF